MHKGEMGRRAGGGEKCYIKFLDTLNTATSGLALVACALVSTFVNFGGALYLKVITQVGGRESSIERLDVFL